MTTPTMIDANILELMASKICHDVISPVGAVSNGVEFLEEMGPDAGEEATALIAFSAQQASARLQMFRYAYGAGGSDSSIKPEDIYNTFEKMIAPDGKVKQSWDPHGEIGPAERPTGLCKMITNGLLLAYDSLPKGGEISLEPENEDTVFIIAQGENAGFPEDSNHALTMQLAQEALSPKLVHPYLCAVLAQHYGFQIRLEEQNDGLVRFAIQML